VPRVARSKPAPEAPLPAPVAHGTYLITGGLGALGLDMARLLVERGARRILLLSRRALPTRASWRSLPDGSAERDKAAAIEQLEASAAPVHAVAGDVGDAARMRALFRGWARDLPPLRGIVHAAGVVEPTLAHELDASGLRRVLRAKVAGVAALDALA